MTGRYNGPAGERGRGEGDGLLGETVALVEDELDGKVVDVQAELKERRAQAQWYCSSLWGRAEGFAALAFGYGGHIGPTGSYRFTRFEQVFLPWPDQRHGLIGMALDASGEADVFCCPLLRRERSRRRGSGGSGRWLWLDLDVRPTPGGVRTLRQLMVRGSFEVASGHGRHVYLKLRRPQPAATLEVLNHRVAAAVGADAKWSEDSLLRLPGCWNHKQRATTGSQLVRLRYLSPHRPMDLAS